MEVRALEKILIIRKPNFINENNNLGELLYCSFMRYIRNLVLDVTSRKAESPIYYNAQTKEM